MSLRLNFVGAYLRSSSGHFFFWPKGPLLAIRKKFPDDDADDKEGDLLPDMTAR